MWSRYDCLTHTSTAAGWACACPLVPSCVLWSRDGSTSNASWRATTRDHHHTANRAEYVGHLSIAYSFGGARAPEPLHRVVAGPRQLEGMSTSTPLAIAGSVNAKFFCSPLVILVVLVLVAAARPAA